MQEEDFGMIVQGKPTRASGVVVHLNSWAAVFSFAEEVLDLAQELSFDGVFGPS